MSWNAISENIFLKIDHDILFQRIVKRIKCPDTLWLIKKIIGLKEIKDSIEYFPGDNLFTPVERKRGIPIGNLTSQFFANLYLNGFDHFVKEHLKQRYYIRYCDDFVMFGNSKTELNEVKAKITDYLGALRLRLHENKSRIYRTSDGVEFLGYRIFPTHMLVKKSNVKRCRKILRKMVSDYRDKKIDLKRVNASIQSRIGHMKHANSYRLREGLFSTICFHR
jgi:RNA-directed DNA polymerase